MKNYLSGTWRQIKFVLRKERVTSSVWVALITLVSVAVAAAFREILAGKSVEQFLLLLDSPATKAMLGPVYGESFAALYAGSMLLFTAVTVGLMNIFLVVRHTRGDEEKGQTEVLRSLPVGRVSNLASVMSVAVIVNVALSLLLGFSLGIVGALTGEASISLGGSLLYGFTLGTAGLFFAGAAALFCQIFPAAQSAAGFSFGLLGLLYMLRAVGDVSADALSAATPLGMILRTEVFTSNKLWPVFVMLLLFAALTAGAFYCNTVRDMGRGLVHEKRGSAHGGRLFKNTGGFAFRLLRTGIIVWAAAMMLLAVSYGSVMDAMPGFIADLGLPVDADTFLTALFSILAIVCSVPAVGAVLKLAGEEKAKRYECIMSRTTVSRYRIMAAFAAISFALSFVMLFAVILGMWGAMTAAMSEPLKFGSLFRSLMVYLPAVWVMTGFAALLTGLFPEKASTVVYSYIGVSGFIIYFGAMLGFPEWTKYLTPFGYIPQLSTGVNLSVTNIIMLAGLVIVAAGLTAAGFAFYKKRDLL